MFSGILEGFDSNLSTPSQQNPFIGDDVVVLNDSPFSTQATETTEPAKPLTALEMLNQATSLTMVPGIGMTLSDRVLNSSYFPFGSFDDLQMIRGIGPKRRQSIEEYFRYEVKKLMKKSQKETSPQPTFQQIRELAL